MISTGKRARKRYGTRAAAKQAKRHKRHGKRKFNPLPVSVEKGNAEQFVRDNTNDAITLDENR